MTIDPGQEQATNNQLVNIGMAYQRAYTNLRAHAWAVANAEAPLGALANAVSHFGHKLEAELVEAGLDRTTARFLALGSELSR